MGTCVFAGVCAYVCWCMCIHMPVHVHMCASVCAYVCWCMWICMMVHVHMSISALEYYGLQTMSGIVLIILQPYSFEADSLNQTQSSLVRHASLTSLS